MDVMDGNFVENRCLNADLVKQVNDNSLIPLDVHLMVKTPKDHIINYINAGANIITIHYESYENITDLLEDVNLIKTTNNTLVGISLKPDTDISAISHILKLFDLVLIMSVVPGKSGQKFIEQSLNKIKELKSIIVENKYNTLIEVDGGVNLDNASSIVNAGADILVMGNALYKAEDRKSIIDLVHKI
jgi:ribulose-phosphate 3-epimerase